MTCNQKIKPEFTAEQRAECRTRNNGRPCIHLSGKEIWCCKFGCFIDGRPEIVKPQRKIIQPDKRIKKPVTEAKYAEFMANDESRFRLNYKYALSYYEESTEQLINEDTFIKRRQQCAQCPPIDKSVCGCAGCKQWQKLVLKSLKCPKGKW